MNTMIDEIIEPIEEPPVETVIESVLDFVIESVIESAPYGHELIANLDAPRYFRLVNGLGTQLNDRKSRFDKSDIIEQSLDIYSENHLQWVDEIGYDMIHAESGRKVEVKYEDYGITTRAGKRSAGKRKKILTFKIKNTLKNLTTHCLSEPADYYLFLDLQTIVGITYAKMEPYLRITKSGDGIECRIPIECVEVLCERGTVASAACATVNYKEEKHKLQRRLIDMV